MGGLNNYRMALQISFKSFNSLSRKISNDSDCQAKIYKKLYTKSWISNLCCFFFVFRLNRFRSWTYVTIYQMNGLDVTSTKMRMNVFQ